MRLVSERELAYLRANSVRESDVQRRLREATEELAERGWAAAPEISQFLALLIEATGARKVIEVGVFTGLSTLAMAMALPEDGRIIACDVEEAEPFLKLARAHWQEAGVAHKIDLRIAAAEQTLDALIAEGAEGSFDLAFIDANKQDYDAYYERALRLVRRGGLIAFDNMLWYGSMVDDSDQSKGAQALRALNAKLHRDERIALSMLPLNDGVTLACKRAS